MIQIGVTLPQAVRSCGNLDPTKVLRRPIKRTPRCMKLINRRNVKSRMHSMTWADQPCAPPITNLTNGEDTCQHMIH